MTMSRIAARSCAGHAAVGPGDVDQRHEIEDAELGAGEAEGLDALGDRQLVRSCR
ncbi:MAG: hypothetical protein V9G11_02685 [Bifidobacterium adolescentis]